MQVGAEWLIIKESTDYPPSNRGINQNLNPVDQHLFFYNEAVKVSSRYNPEIVFSPWPATDYGVPKSSAAPLNWYQRSAANQASEYYSTLYESIDNDIPIIWQGRSKTVDSKGNVAGGGTNGDLGKQKIVFLDPSASWDAQLFRAYQSIGNNNSNIHSWILNFESDAAKKSISLPTIYSAADYLWNSGAYKPDEEYFSAIVDHLSGQVFVKDLTASVKKSYFEFVQNYIQKYALIGNALDGETYLRNLSNKENLETTIAELGEFLTLVSDQLSNKIFSTQSSNMIRGFSREINPILLIFSTQRGSLDTKLQAIRNLSYIADDSIEKDLRPLLSDPNIQVQIAGAGLILYAYSNPVARTMIETNINNPLDSVRSKAIAALVYDKRNSRLTDLKKWQANPGSGTRIQIAAAYVLADRGDRKMFEFLIDCVTDRDLTREEHDQAVGYLQNLTGLDLPIPYINNSGNIDSFRAAFSGKVQDDKKKK